MLLVGSIAMFRCEVLAVDCSNGWPLRVGLVPVLRRHRVRHQPLRPQREHHEKDEELAHIAAMTAACRSERRGTRTSAKMVAQFGDMHAHSTVCETARMLSQATARFQAYQCLVLRAVIIENMFLPGFTPSTLATKN